MNFSSWAKNVVAWSKNSKTTIRRGAIAGAWACIPVLQARTKEVDAVASRKFLTSWFVITKGLKMPEIINLAPYSQFVEYGRNPGRMPPVNAILRWVEIKFKVGGPEAMRIAWAIAHKIKAQGVKGRFIMKSSRPKMLKIMGEHIVKALRDDWKSRK